MLNGCKVTVSRHKIGTLLAKIRHPVWHSVLILNVKALLGAFNLERALVEVGAFSVIVKTDCKTDVGQSGEGC